MATYGDLIRESANRLGIDPLDWANVISYETRGTFDPTIRGGAGNRYVGLIQMGPEERKSYGGGTDQDFETNLKASERYMKARGLKPGMGLLDIYSTINAGSPGHYEASDGHNTVAGHVQEMSGAYRAKAANLLGTEYSPPKYTAPAVVKDAVEAMGPATVIGGISNEPMYAPRRTNGLVDVNDNEYWSQVAPETVAKSVATPAPVAPGAPVPLARPASEMDAPVTENAPITQSLQKNVASRVVYKNGQPEFELYDPDAERNAKIEPLTTTSTSAISGSAGSDSLPGGDDEGPMEDLPEATSPGNDDLMPDLPSEAAAAGDHHSEMTQQSIAAINAATAPKPMTPLQESAVGLHNLFHNITLGADTGILGATGAMSGEQLGQLAAAREQWKQEHPIQQLGQGVVGPMPAVMTGMGMVGRGLTAAGTELASQVPSLAPAVSATGRALSGQLGSWAGNVWDKLARAGNLVGIGAAEGATQGAMTSNLTEQPLSEDVALGAMIGGAISPVAGAVGHLITKDVVADLTAGANEVYNQASKVFTNRAALPLAGRLVAQDTPLGQVHARLMSNEAENRNLKAWTDQTMEFMGSSHKAATLSNLEDAGKEIGRHFDQVIQAAHVTEDPTLARDLGSIWSDVRANMHRGPQYNAVDKELTRIVSDLTNNGGVLTPELFQSITRSTSQLGKMIRGNDAGVSAYAKQIQDTLTDWVDRGYAENVATNGLMKIPGLGEGTPSALYSAARERWKLNQAAIDSIHATGNYSGILDPQALASALKTRGRSVSSDPNNKLRVLMQTAMYMPQVTKQGTAIAVKTPYPRWISNLMNFESSAGAMGSAAGLAYRFGQLSPMTSLGLGATAAGAVALRNAFIRSRLASPDFVNELLGQPGALAKESGRSAARRNLITGTALRGYEETH